MDISEFTWHARSYVTEATIRLKRGGAEGVTFAEVRVEDLSWIALLNLHLREDDVRRVVCRTEMDAIETVESWLEGLLAAQLAEARRGRRASGTIGC